MFTKKRRQIPTWELALMAVVGAAGIVGGGTPGLIVAIALIAVVGVYLIWAKL